MTYNYISTYQANEQEREKASNSYLMSLIAIMAGMPLPIINLIATLIFYLGNRKSSRYVRWHCTQTLLSQMTLLIINSIGFSWTLSIAFGDEFITNNYIGYMLTISLFNLGEFSATIYAAVQTRKGQPVYFWFWGALTDIVCAVPKESPEPDVSESQTTLP